MGVAQPQLSEGLPAVRKEGLAEPLIPGPSPEAAPALGGRLMGKGWGPGAPRALWSVTSGPPWGQGFSRQCLREDTGQPITPVPVAVDRHSVSVPGARGDSVMTGGMVGDGVTVGESF